MEIGNVKIDFLGHSGFFISYRNGHGSERKIAIDPYNVSSNAEKADVILITHSHYDHCSIKDIEKLSERGTIIILPPDAQSKITRIEGVQMQIVEAGDEISFGDIKVEAFPAYNLSKEFHPKSEGWLGYLIKSDKVIIYHAGDSDNIPEMRKLSGYGKHGNEFIALLPVSGTYVMNAEEAAAVAQMINPSFAIPMHYGAGVAGSIEDAELFAKLCEDNGIKTMILEKT